MRPLVLCLLILTVYFCNHCLSGMDSKQAAPTTVTTAAPAPTFVALNAWRIIWGKNGKIVEKIVYKFISSRRLDTHTPCISLGRESNVVTARIVCSICAAWPERGKMKDRAFCKSDMCRCATSAWLFLPTYSRITAAVLLLPPPPPLLPLLLLQAHHAFSHHHVLICGKAGRQLYRAKIFQQTRENFNLTWIQLINLSMPEF